MRPLMAKEALRDAEAFDVAVTEDWRYEAFFNFLRVSPTYLLADKLSRPGQVQAADALPRDFDKVQRVFADLRSVHARSFAIWWDDIGRYRFGFGLPPEIDVLSLLRLQEEPSDAQLRDAADKVKAYLKDWRQSLSSPATVLLAVPLVPDKRAMLAALDEKLTEIFEQMEDAGALAQYRALTKGVQERSVHVAWTTLCFLAAFPDDDLWRIASRVEGATAKKKAERDEAAKRLSRKEPPDESVRVALASELCRVRNRAYFLAENAARGLFPSDNPALAGKPPAKWWTYLDGPLAREVKALRAGHPLPQWERLPRIKDKDVPAPMPKARASHS